MQGKCDLVIGFDCTAIGNLDHSHNQDCGIIQSYRKENSDGETQTKNLHPRV